MHVHRAATRRQRRPWQLTVDIIAAIFLFSLLVYQVRFLAVQLQPPQAQHISSRTAADNINLQSSPSFHLGFPYPQTAKSGNLVLLLLSQQQQNSWAELTAAYGAALHALQDAHSRNSTTAHTRNGQNTDRTLQAFLQEAFAVLSSDVGLLHCADDTTLLAAWQATAAHAASATARVVSLQDRRYLLAANFHNSAAVLPNFIIQTLRLALLLPKGQLAVSCYESGSSDTSRMWLTLLHQLLLPLGVPHHITVGGDLSPRLELGRIQLLAALRNALLEPWMPPRRQHQQQQQQHIPASGQQQFADVSRHSWLQRLRVWGDAADRHKETATAAAAGFAVLEYHTDGYTPDTLVFANDVFFCAGDALRLAMHDADIACGMDFYTAPWEQQHGSRASGSGSSSKGDASTAISEADATEPAAHTNSSQVSNVNGKHYHTDSSSAESSSSNGDGTTINSDDDDDDYLFYPGGQQVQQASADSKPGGAHGSLRFYDKWVARDQAGARLSNSPPYLRHPSSQAQLAAGQPVAMTCCWNGLAAVTAAPFVTGVQFRSHQAGECQASECSLMCDDLARLGHRHVVMDPGVRLAYHLEQIDSLGGAATPLASASDAVVAAAGTSRGEAAGSGEGVAAAASAAAVAAARQLPGLGPRLPWQQVAATSQRLAAAAAAAVNCLQQGFSSGAACKGVVQAAGQRLVECCDLQPGQSYVNFKRHCHMVDSLAHNYTADALAT